MQEAVRQLVIQIQKFQEKYKDKTPKLYSPEDLILYLSSLDDESLEKTLQLAAMIAIGRNASTKNPTF